MWKPNVRYAASCAKVGIVVDSAVDGSMSTRGSGVEWCGLCVDMIWHLDRLSLPPVVCRRLAKSCAMDDRRSSNLGMRAGDVGGSQSADGDVVTEIHVSSTKASKVR